MTGVIIAIVIAAMLLFRGLRFGVPALAVVCISRLITAAAGSTRTSVNRTSLYGVSLRANMLLRSRRRMAASTSALNTRR